MDGAKPFNSLDFEHQSAVEQDIDLDGRIINRSVESRSDLHLSFDAQPPPLQSSGHHGFVDRLKQPRTQLLVDRDSLFDSNRSQLIDRNQSLLRVSLLLRVSA